MEQRRRHWRLARGAGLWWLAGHDLLETCENFKLKRFSNKSNKFKHEDNEQSSKHEQPKLLITLFVYCFLKVVFSAQEMCDLSDFVIQS